jgi:hypothetical protein
MVSLSTLILFSSWVSDCIASPSNKVSVNIPRQSRGL